MTKKVTVNLFDVRRGNKTQPVSHTLREYQALPIEERWRGDIRLESIRLLKSDAALPVDVYELAFAKSRDIGPGKLTRQEPIADVGLSKEELFGEETAALYVPSKKWLVVLHNQYGVGPARIAEYLNALSPGESDRHFDYEVTPRIDAHALDKMKKMKHLSGVSVTANVGAFENADDELGESVKDAVSTAKAVRLHLKLEANPAHKRGGTLDFSKVRRLVDSLLKNSEDVDKLEVKGGDHMDAKDQMINLLHHKVRQQFPDSQLIVVNHRYSFESKIHLLSRACRVWLDSID